MYGKRCVYCGQMIAGADYHVVGVGQDYANLYACVGCWRVRGIVAQAGETGGNRYDAPNLRQAGLWGVGAAFAILASATGLYGLVVTG